MNKLPNKKSDLLLLALEDYFKIKNNPKYCINMQVWHSIYEDRLCHVCLSGVIMAGTLRTPFNQIINILDFEDPIIEKFRFLDRVRVGILSDLDIWNIFESNEYNEFERKISNYGDPELFECYIQDIIGILQAEGL